MLLRTTFAGAALALISAIASAQTAPPAQTASAAMPRADARRANQERRIEQGVASGQLTPRETRRLEREQRAIARAENRARADGQVTAQERRHLHHMQNRASRDIYRQKHDAQRMPQGGPGNGPNRSPGG